MINLATLFDRAKAIGRILRGHEGASGSSRWTPPSMMFSPARVAQADAARLAARANYRVANGASAEAIASVWSANLVGDGPSARAKHPNRVTRRALELAWGKFYARVDVDGFDLCGFLNRVVRSLVIAGEALVIMTTTQRGELLLRLLSNEQLDRGKNIESSGGRIDAGVERNADGEIVAYWIFVEQPEAMPSLLRPSVRVAAEDVLFLYDAKWPGQTRGVSWLTPVLTLLQQLDRLIDALVERMNTAALFSGFISDPEGGAAGFDTTGNGIEEGIIPGALRNIGTATITFPTVPGVENSTELIRHVLRQIGSGTGIPYELLAGDLSQVNYSSAKAAFSQFFRRCRAIRASMLGARLLDRIWQRWATLEVLSGRLAAPDFEQSADDYFAVSWGWPEWELLDALKEASADVTLLNAGIKSRQEIIESRGRDFEDTNSELLADNFIPKINAGGNLPANVESQNA